MTQTLCSRNSYAIEQSDPSKIQDMIWIDEKETKNYRFQKAKESEDIYHALKLVQDVYIQEGYVDKKKITDPCRILKNHSDEKSAVFVGKKDKEVAFTVSLFPDSPWGLPMDDIYKEELDQLRLQRRRIGEVGCLATHPDHRAGTQNVLMHGNKMVINYAMNQLHLDDLVIVVHPRHAMAYKGALLFEDVNPGEIRSYPTVNNNPAVALRLDLRKIKERWRQHYQDVPLEANLYHFVFIKQSQNMEGCGNAQPFVQFGPNVFSQIHEVF